VDTDDARAHTTDKHTTSLDMPASQQGTPHMSSTKSKRTLTVHERRAERVETQGEWEITHTTNNTNGKS
jgi:hypothetical protein